MFRFFGLQQENESELFGWDWKLNGKLKIAKY